MKLVGFILACLLLINPFMLLTSSGESALSIAWQRNSGFDLSTGINGQWTVTAHLVANTTTYVEFYLDDKLQLNDTRNPYSWTFNTDSYPEGQHIVKAVAYTLTGETVTATNTLTFIGFPSVFIVGVLLLGSIIFAFALLLTYYLIKQKAKTRILSGKINGPQTQENVLLHQKKKRVTRFSCSPPLFQVRRHPEVSYPSRTQ